MMLHRPIVMQPLHVIVITLLLQLLLLMTMHDCSAEARLCVACCLQADGDTEEAQSNQTRWGQATAAVVSLRQQHATGAGFVALVLAASPAVAVHQPRAEAAGRL
jgi:hypothetical protein